MVSRPVCGLWCFLGGVVEEEGERRRIAGEKFEKARLTWWMIDRVAGAQV